MRVPTHGEPDGTAPDEFVVEVYERVLGNPGATVSTVSEEFAARADVERAVRVLRQLRLLADESGDATRLVAVSPEIAQVELFLPLQRAIHHNNRQLAASRQRLLAFEDAFDRAQRGKPSQRTTVISGDLPEVEARLAAAAHECTTEVLMMQTCVAQEPQEARYVRPLLLDAVRRGARARMLYPHTGRGDTVTRSYLRDVTEAGGKVRTSSDIFERFIVFDRTIAFVLTSADDEHDHTVAVVHEPVIAEFLCRIHQHAWQSAMRFNPRQLGYSGALGVLKSSILDLLASGLTDDAIARRAGISERTLRRHIAAIMRDMSADSRFQAGVAAAKAGLVAATAKDPSQEPDGDEPHVDHSSRGGLLCS